MCTFTFFFSSKYGYYIKKKEQITFYAIKLNERGLYITYYLFHVTKYDYTLTSTDANTNNTL